MFSWQKEKSRDISSPVMADGSKPRQSVAIPIMPVSNRIRPEDNYRVQKKLGEGAFGVCHLVEDTSDGSAYVLKRMKCQDKVEMLEALKEMVMMRICTSPFVVKFKEFYKDDVKLEVCLLMEFCEEGDLFHRLREAYEAKVTLPEEQILRWITQIALALESIHAKKFVHRDLKPGNIFLSRWDVVKLGDFGLGVFLERDKGQSKDEEVAGTPGFIAPEILQGKTYDAKSDVFALGCCLYEMLTLRSAYYDTKNDYFPQPPPDGVYSDAISDLLLKLLTPDPAHRPSIETVLQSPLLKDRAVAMRAEQELLGKVMDLERNIGYKHHERRKHAAKSYLAGSVVEKNTKISEVVEEWNTLVQKAHNGNDIQDGKELPEHVVANLDSQMSLRKNRVTQLEQKLRSDNRDPNAEDMAKELAELRDRNAVFEVLLEDMRKEKRNQRPRGDAEAEHAMQEALLQESAQQEIAHLDQELHAVQSDLDMARREASSAQQQKQQAEEQLRSERLKAAASEKTLAVQAAQIEQQKNELSRLQHELQNQKQNQPSTCCVVS